LQVVHDKHHQVFETPKGLPSSPGEHDHGNPLILGIQPPYVHTYVHSFRQKNEIENIIQELLEVGVIHPSTSPYSSPVFMVSKKEGTWHMCLYFRALNNLTIKDKFLIPVIDHFLDELHGAKFSLSLIFVHATTK
jgi:hypothetical protein